jgi:hypothetical protein
MMTTSDYELKDWEKKVDPNTNLWDRLPLEVKNIIFMFESGMNFREKMDLAQIRISAIKVSMLNHSKANFISYYNDGVWLMPWARTLYPGEAEHFIEICSKCTCCAVHQLKRPTTDDYLNGYTPPLSYRKYVNHEKSCKCYCRSLCRRICCDINMIDEGDYEDLPALIDDDEESDDDEYQQG